jgi:hypothetical protein
LLGVTRTKIFLVTNQYIFSRLVEIKLYVPCIVSRENSEVYKIIPFVISINIIDPIIYIFGHEIRIIDGE